MAINNLYIEETFYGSTYTEARGGSFGNFWINLAYFAEFTEELTKNHVMHLDCEAVFGEELRTVGEGGKPHADSEAEFTELLLKNRIMHLDSVGEFTELLTMTKTLLLAEVFYGSSETIAGGALTLLATGLFTENVYLCPVIHLANEGEFTEEVTTSIGSATVTPDWTKESPPGTTWLKS